MKKAILLAGVISLLVFSCDIVNPYVEPYTPPADNQQRRVLLEEYTGMRCVNCPDAAKQAALLKETFGERLIVVSIHAGGFAIPYGIFQPDLRTEAGNSYFSHYGLAGTPIGVINRKSQDGSVGASPGLWLRLIQNELDAVVTESLELAVDYRPETRQYSCRISATSVTKGSLHVILWLIEDQIETPQIIPGGVDEHYQQRHVLRGALNGTWGESITADPEGVWKAERHYTLPENYRPRECRVVALLTEGAGKVVDVREVSLITDNPIHRELSSLKSN